MSYRTEKRHRAIRHFGESKVVVLDISKVFDKIWHDTFVSKLIEYGVDSIFTPFIPSFLNNRSIKIVINRCSSNDLYLNAGVALFL